MTSIFNVNRPFSAIQYLNLSRLNISDLAAKFSLLHHKEISGDFYLFRDKCCQISFSLSPVAGRCQR